MKMTLVQSGMTLALLGLGVAGCGSGKKFTITNRSSVPNWSYNIDNKKAGSVVQSGSVVVDDVEEKKAHVFFVMPSTTTVTDSSGSTLKYSSGMFYDLFLTGDAEAVILDRTTFTTDGNLGKNGNITYPRPDGTVR